MTLASLSGPAAHPPERPEAEASLLGAILLDPKLLTEVIDRKIQPEDLSRASHSAVLAAMLRVAEQGGAVERGAVQNELERADELEGVGGPQFLAGLIQQVPSVMHGETYARIVERTAVMRRLIRAANDIAHLALTQEVAREAVREAQETLFGVSESLLGRDLIALKRAVTDFTHEVAARKDDAQTGLPSGLGTLDKMTGGFQKSDLILVAGRPGLGKTSLALNFVAHAGVRHERPCAVFSLEMSELQVVQRLVSIRAQIDSTRMRLGRLSIPELQAVSAASAELQAAPIFVEESTRLTVRDILVKARRMQAEHRLDLVVIDYLQLIEGVRTFENRVAEIAHISGALKAIARELQVPVIALSQLSRHVETREPEPMLSDLRDGGSLEADADMVLFLWQRRDEKDDRDRIVRLKVAKHRNGPTGEIELYFDSNTTGFRDLGESAEAEA